MGKQDGHPHRIIPFQNIVFIFFQYLMPKHFISRILGKLAASENSLLKTTFIAAFKKIYRVSLATAERKSSHEYNSFNDFFSRTLESKHFPAQPQNHLIYSPAAGTISQTGDIENGMLLQAKGHEYSLAELSKIDTKPFLDGSFITVYLSPSDYHRVHLPLAGLLQKTVAIPGSLFSVNDRTEHSIKNLFAKNERLVCEFLTDSGPMLVILVGALVVASIEMNWAGPQSPYKKQQVSNYDTRFSSCSEIGRFLLGSTVICCFPQRRFKLDTSLCVGEKLEACTPIGKVI